MGIKKADQGRLFLAARYLFGDVFADQARQFKHGDLVFAKNRLEFGISVDVALVGSVLQVVGLDVNPQFADDFGAGQRGFSHHGSQCCIGSQWLHEGGIGCAFLRGFSSRGGGAGFLCSCHVYSFGVLLHWQALVPTKVVQMLMGKTWVSSKLTDFFI